MENKDKTFEVKIIGKEKAKELEQKVINKIGEDKDTVSFITGKIVETIAHESATTTIFLVMLFISIIEKYALLVVFSAAFAFICLYGTFQNISLINKLQKTQIPSKK